MTIPITIIINIIIIIIVIIVIIIIIIIISSRTSSSNSIISSNIRSTTEVLGTTSAIWDYCGQELKKNKRLRSGMSKSRNTVTLLPAHNETRQVGWLTDSAVLAPFWGRPCWHRLVSRRTNRPLSAARRRFFIPHTSITRCIYDRRQISMNFTLPVHDTTSDAAPFHSNPTRCALQPSMEDCTRWFTFVWPVLVIILCVSHECLARYPPSVSAPPSNAPKADHHTIVSFRISKVRVSAGGSVINSHGSLHNIQVGIETCSSDHLGFAYKSFTTTEYENTVCSDLHIMYN